MNFSCSALATQYDLCVAQQGKVYFACKSDTPLFTQESRISRCFHSAFYGYSFDLTENTKKLVQKVSIFAEVPTKEEIHSRLKVLSILDRMLSHTMEARGDSSLSSLEVKNTINDKIKHFPADCIELSLSLNKPLAEISPFIPFMTREDLDALYDVLVKKYPSGLVNAVYMKAFTIDTGHLKTGCVRHAIPSEAPDKVPLSTLETIFDSIDWKNDGAKLYEVVFRRSPESGSDEKSLLHDLLSHLLSRIASREKFRGTPQRGEALEDFYSKIENALRYSVEKLLEVKNPKLTFEFMKEILTAAQSPCGGEYHKTAIEQYLHICKEIDMTPRVYFETILADYRRLCFEGVVGELHPGDVYVLSQALKELGIPGAEDLVSHEGYVEGRISHAFFERAYTPYSIVFEYLLPLISQDVEPSEKYVDLQKEIMPQDWNDEKYRSVYEELSTIPENLSTQDREKEEDKLLEKHSIMRAKNQTAQKAIEADRLVDYLENFVYDKEGKKTRAGLIYALERLGIIHCSLTYNDPSKKVIPLPQESP
jgi:hypothetical protein